ncbi:MAG TPA: hypothetical protein DCG42_18090 [Maribacter sp.]|uniref:hypothetical protein n=1 Tax=unclassified Maribacter TaxID=2615042 RepID=UPI000EE56FD0|nr:MULTISPECIES: hypothetical protein [unclassified Maribacter]HAF79222.1 hypothetical protein [Maribacter sp.]|tara:strand:+ start:98928 stop:99650 length:723 start_codon:yes stop_codon:yes gene_type:complete
MLLPKTNIEQKLSSIKKKRILAEDIDLKQVYSILSNLDNELDRIENNVIIGNGVANNKFNIDLLKSDKIYHTKEIKQICIDYRLRFLDTKYFKGTIPAEGLSKIKALEKEHDTEIKGFKIIAPSKLFKLEDKDDPLLFAPIGNGYYYLIHQWGNDLHPFRKLLMWPFKNMANLIILVLLISFLVTLMIPNGLFSKSSTNAQFWILYFFMFKCIASVVIFYGFALGKNFSPAIWNSKYYNS